tara:strand:- start:2889 stop:3875 length:987 start_codon:yes stop_codon:yes gene_type:complete
VSKIKDTNILITGVTGFIGHALYKSISSSEEFNVIGVARRRNRNSSLKSKFKYVDDIGPNSDWKECINDMDTIFHLAGKAHDVKEETEEHRAEYMHVNAEGTLNLARQAAAAGVRRFIFISSIKVNGNFTKNDSSYTSSSIPAPLGPYAKSKEIAEVGLRKLADETEMEVVIIRPSLVYGPGVKGNFKTLLRFINIGIPIPLGLATKNKRSFVGIDNLIELLIISVNHPAAANKTFLVSDDNDISTYELVKLLRNLSKSRAIIVPIPIFFLKFFGKLFGLEDSLQTLLASLKVDISDTKAILQWTPSNSFEEGIRKMIHEESSKKNFL